MKTAPPTGVVFDPIYKMHKPRFGHPESPERCDAVMRGISELVPATRLRALKPRPATRAELMLCHDESYIDTAESDIKSGCHCLSTGDTDVSERSYEVALVAAGGLLVAVDAMMTGTIRNAFCCVRPPGHHATQDRGMGFCIFNNAAIAARYVQKKHGVERVLIADWDIHHGNGTQDIFYDDPSVFYFSTHQWPLYPGTGSFTETGIGPGKGYTLNCPFAAGSGGTEIIGAFKEKLVPAMRQFKPQFVIISAGFDSRIGDPLGQFFLSDDDYDELTGIVMKIAADYASDRLISTLEGGYSLGGLEAGVGAHVRRLASP